MVRAGFVYRGLMVAVRASNAKLRDRAGRIVATLTGVDRAAGLALLEAAGGDARVAVLMHHRGLDRELASARLAAAHGHLARALEA